jgi:hypothetical protein
VSGPVEGEREEIRVAAIPVEIEGKPYVVQITTFWRDGVLRPYPYVGVSSGKPADWAGLYFRVHVFKAPEATG